MTCELASTYLDLPPCLLTSPAFQPLINAAKEFLVEKFKILSMCEKEGLNLPLLGIQTILSSDDMRVTSECEVYNLVLKWARKHYPNLEERREILKTHLLHLVRFPFMTTTELTKEVQTCEDIDPELASKILIRALTFKAETPHQKRRLAAEKGNQYMERDYERLPVKVVELMLPRPQCIVYLHFARERIYPHGVIVSETFHLDEHEFTFVGNCYKASTTSYFWLALVVVGSATYTVNYDIQLLMEPFQEFKSWVKGSHNFTQQDAHITTEFIIGDGNTYFINGFLHVRAVLTVME